MAARAGTVVVIDDEADLREVLCSLLSDEGYQVRCLGHPDQAVALEADRQLPDLFVLDLMLPAMDGITLARRLRDDGFPRTPMLAISASPLMLRRAAESHVFEDVVSKPFDVETLLSTVDRHMR
jgi:CheY-like chemotaxis protein